jgi:hypothetical protein
MVAGQIMSKMRNKQLKQIVCTTGTGNAEADMLGNILIWVERSNRPPSHRFHRKKPVRMSNMSKLRVVVKRTWRALNELLRRGKSIPGKGKDDTPKYLSGLRKNRVNR